MARATDLEQRAAAAQATVDRLAAEAAARGPAQQAAAEEAAAAAEEAHAGELARALAAAEELKVQLAAAVGAMEVPPPYSWRCPPTPSLAGLGKMAWEQWTASCGNPSLL